MRRANRFHTLTKEKQTVVWEYDRAAADYYKRRGEADLAHHHYVQARQGVIKVEEQDIEELAKAWTTAREEVGKLADEWARVSTTFGFVMGMSPGVALGLGYFPPEDPDQ